LNFKSTGLVSIDTLAEYNPPGIRPLQNRTAKWGACILANSCQFEANFQLRGTNLLETTFQLNRKKRTFA